MSAGLIPQVAENLASGEAAPPRVGTSLHVETPENVVLDYQLAGPTVRGLAYLLDTLVRTGIMLVMGIFLGLASAVWSGGVSFGLYLVLGFTVYWFYYVVCEVCFRGKTIGKHALGIRVIQARGYPISFWPSCLRNIVRVVDAMPFLLQQAWLLGMQGVGFITILVTKRGQRLGDLVAGTVVIAERPVRLPKEPIILEKIQPLSRNDILSSYVPDSRTLSTIEEFLGRRFVLTHERGHALAGPLAAALAERLNFQGEAKLVQQYPMAFLARIYTTYLHRVEEEEDADLSTESLYGHSSVNLSRA